MPLGVPVPGAKLLTKIRSLSDSQFNDLIFAVEGVAPFVLEPGSLLLAGLGLVTVAGRARAVRAEPRK